MTKRAWAYILATIAVGALLVVLAPLVSTAKALDWAVWAVLAAAATATQLTKSLFQSKHEGGALAYSPTLIFFFAGIMMLPPALFVLLVVAPHLVEWVNERRRKSSLLAVWYIQPYNIATHVIAGAVAYLLLLTPAPASFVYFSFPVLLALLAVSVYVLINHLLIGQALLLARDVSWQASGLLRLESLLPDLVMMSLGYGLAMLWAVNPWMSIPVLSPLLLIQRALQVPQLKKDAQTDGKTGLLNARYFGAMFAAELDRSRRLERPMALIMADLDLLRNVNNTYGHLAGDAVLTGIGKIIRDTIREYDIAGRFGGEEFAIVLPETDQEGARAFAERLRRAIELAEFAISTSSTPICVTMSLGVAAMPQDATTMNDLTHEADIAVYQAKLQGRNCVICSQEVPHFVKLANAPSITGGADRYTVAAGQAKVERRATPPAEAQSPPRSQGAPPATVLPQAQGPGGRERRIKPNPSPQSRLLGLYVGGVVAEGAIVFALSLPTLAQANLLAVALLTLLAALFEFWQIDVYGGNTVSVNIAMIFVAALIAGIPGVAAVGAAIALTHGLIKRPPAYRIAFNWANHLLAGLPVFLLVRNWGVELRLENLPALAVPVALAAGAAYLIETGLVAGALALTTHGSTVAIWRKQFQWLAGHYLVLCVMGLFLGIAYYGMGTAGLLVFTLPVVMMRFAQQQYVARTKDSVQELSRLNEELARANREVLGASLAIKQVNDELFQTLAKMLDSRDPYVGGHAAQVSCYATAIALELELPAARVEAVRQAAFMHDIGKIAIAEAVLNKPSRLTEEEYEYIKTHAAIGADLLETSQGLRHLAPFVRGHHERWDGQGYPDRLAGEQIPLEARILGVCDAVEAMASDRPYQKGKSLAEIIDELNRCAGTQFDPQVAATFVRIAEREGEKLVINSARAVISRQAEQGEVAAYPGGWRPVPFDQPWRPVLAESA